MGNIFPGAKVVFHRDKLKDKLYIILPELAEDLIKLLDGRKRFWEWEQDIEVLTRIRKAQAAMINKLTERLKKERSKEGEAMNYRKLLEKYMRDVVDCEGTAFVEGEWWCGCGYTEAEHAVLLAMRDQIYKEEKP